jgi:hypothetical protein
MPVSLPPAGTGSPVDDPLWRWVCFHTGIRIASEHVCADHHPPWEFFSFIHRERPPLALIHGPRGRGKSMLSALDAHKTCRDQPRHGVRILGGSKAQSEQIYRALRELVVYNEEHLLSDNDAFEQVLKDRALYQNGSEIAILAASSRSVRGPHVPTLKLDEVDEIDSECREAAIGMCMNRRRVPASIVMTSTWHKVNGPMTGLLDRGRAGAFPLFTFCVFEILERCPDSRSGLHLEHCGECPLMRWCHSDRDQHPSGLPKAKRSNGHYGIDALIQKTRAASERTFEADFLCYGPKTDGLWFSEFDPTVHVGPRGEYDAYLPVHVAVDSGVFTGAVFFQVAHLAVPGGITQEIRVFADYLSENNSAERNALAIIELARTRCNGRIDVASTDPAGGARNPIGPTVIGEFERVGLRPLRRWPSGPPADGLALIESFVQPADGRSRLIIHPRCVSLILAMQNYRRAKRGGQWQDWPEDPQHPHEDLVDALRGGLRTYFPEGRAAQPHFARVPARQVF